MNNNKFLSWFVPLLCVVGAIVISDKLANYSGAPKAVGNPFALSENEPPGIYPNYDLTPGTTNPDITQENIKDNICNPAWSTKSIRPSTAYTGPLKIKLMKEYGLTDAPAGYELDHLISLELGGNPKDEKNLWPEKYDITGFIAGVSIKLGAREKDRVENYLHREVCSGNMPLVQAQSMAVNNWVDVYELIIKNTGSTDSADISTSDDE